MYGGKANLDRYVSNLVCNNTRELTERTKPGIEFRSFNAREPNTVFVQSKTMWAVFKSIACGEEEQYKQEKEI